LTGILYEEASFWPFLILTIGLGGWTARIAGRSLANSWHSNLLLPLIALPLVASVRFLHFALYGATLFSIPYFLTGYGFILVFAVWGYLIRRAELMNGLYPWAFRRYGPFNWREIKPL
jgi:predicted MFS family arabinose efflux permease